MIIIVETNFIIEVVRQQEQSAFCEEILNLSSPASGAHVAIPAFAVIEAGMVFERNRGQRRKFVQEDVRGFVRESGRATILRRFERSISELDAEFVRAQNDEDDRWLNFRVVILDGMEVIPVTNETIDESIALEIGREVDRLPDAIVFASVTQYLSRLRAAGVGSPACFISRDKAAFNKRVLTEQLRELNCSYIDSFEHALARIRASIR